MNATGPWVRSFITDNMGAQSPYGIRLIKGSHIIVPKIHNEEQAYILQNDDERIVFVIPYLEDYSLIGTTDVEFKGDARNVTIDDQEIDYLIDVVNKHFIHQIKRDDVSCLHTVEYDHYVMMNRILLKRLHVITRYHSSKKEQTRHYYLFLEENSPLTVS